MRDADRKITGTLYGIGIGPGEPGLMTLKARDILEAVDTIFVPKSSQDNDSYARAIVENVISKHKNFRELVFPMTKDKKILEKYWLMAARKIAKDISENKKAAFITIGDPFIYSTYIYLAQMMEKNFPGVKLQAVPGISAINAAASCAGINLVKRNEKLAVLPVAENLQGIQDAFKNFDTVVLMKVGSKLDKVLHLLKKTKLIKNSVLVSRAGLSDQKIVKDLKKLKGGKLGYLSVIIVKTKRGER